MLFEPSRELLDSFHFLNSHWNANIQKEKKGKEKKGKKRKGKAVFILF